MPVLDNFGSQFISISTTTENGLMSSYDKIKLDSIKLEDVEYINDGLQDINESMKPQFIYGIKIDKNGNVTYTDDAVTFTPLSVNQNTGICNYGSWKSIIDNVLGVQPCLVKPSGEVIFKLNPNDYTKTIDGNPIDIESGEFGQVMIRFNHIYYRFSVDEEFIRFQISNKQNDSTWIDTAFASEDGIGSIRKHMYISAYEVAQKNNILQSISNALPSFKLSYEEIETLTEFGVFHMMNIMKKQFITFLGYLVTKSIDLKETIGIGNIEGPVLKTGTMNDKGLFYGKKSNTIEWKNVISKDFNIVKYGNGMWVAGGSNNTGMYYSTNGLSWTQSNLTNIVCRSLHYANGLWVVGTTTAGIYYSEDGIVWNQSNITRNDIYSLYYANGTWAASRYSSSGNTIYGGVLYSTDGKTWVDPDNEISKITIGYVYYANGLWIACSGFDFNLNYRGIFYSTDCINWTQSSITRYDVYCVYYDNNLWVASTDHGMHYSIDGKTWIKSNITSGNFKYVYYSEGLWVTHTTSNAYYSTDGKNWIKSSALNSSGLSNNYIEYGDGLWLMINAGNLYYSKDGKSWIKYDTTIKFNHIYYNNAWTIANRENLFYGNIKNINGVKIFGIENLWGNQLKYMHGIVQKLTYVLNHDTGLQDIEQHLYIKESYPYDNIQEFTNCGKIEPNMYGYIASIRFLTESIYFPDKLNGSSISYYKSYFQNGKSNDATEKLYGVYGGSNKYGDKVGPEFLLLAYLNPEEIEATTHLVY